MSGERQASEPILDWFRRIKDGRLGSGDAHMYPTDPPTTSSPWVGGVFAWRKKEKKTTRDASQSSTTTAVNVNTGKVEQLLPSVRSASMNFRVHESQSTADPTGLCVTPQK